MSIEEIEKLEIWENPDYSKWDLEKMRNNFIMATEAKNNEEEEKELEEQEANDALLERFETTMELKYTKIDLKKLKVLLQKWIITQENIDAIVQEEMLSRSDIEAIFNQIDKISKLKNNGASLPDELMMKKGDYLEALTDLKERLASIEKLKEALIYLRENHRHDQWFLYLIYNIYTIFEKNLQLIQQDFINTDPSLQKVVHWFEKKQRKNFWDKMMNFFK